MNKFDEMRQAVQEARTTLAAADSCAFVIADLLVDRLRKVDSRRVLTALKKELQGYNMHTGEWK